MRVIRESHLTRREVIALTALGLIGGAPGPARASGPEGQLTWGVHVSLAPIWFDPADNSGIITPFLVLYALHDALVKPMPGQALAPSLAESFTAAEDGLSYEFVLRQGAMFHNGDPVTADCRRPIKMSPLCQLEMTLPGGYPEGVGGDGSADERRGAFAVGSVAGYGSA